MMNFNYDDIQITEVSRRLNNVVACKIIAVDSKSGIRLEVAKNQTIELMPKDFEVFKYETGMWVDCQFHKINGQVVGCRRIGMTPEVFIPQ